MTSTTFDPAHGSVGSVPAPCNEVGEFISGYSAWLWGCGSTCGRMEKNVRRIAATYGYSVDLSIMPRHVTVVLQSGEGGDGAVFTRRSVDCGINFDLNTALSALSWKITDSRLSLPDARKMFDDIVGVRYVSGWHITFLASLANASFCRLFGGDAVAMGVVFAATFLGFCLKHALLRWHIDTRVIFVLCATLSSFLCAASAVSAVGDTPFVAKATGVLYLIPGVPYINAASDFISRRYLCALSRSADALVLTAALSAGMVAGDWLAGRLVAC